MSKRKDKIIGEGSYGFVYEVVDKNGNHYAEKWIKPGLSDADVTRVKRGVSIQKKLKHPNIVEILEDMLDVYGCYSMPLAECDLCEAIERKMPIDKDVIFIQILDSVEYAHNEGFIHRDLHPGNILIFLKDYSYIVKVGDFEICIPNSVDLKDRPTTHTERIGHPYYTAPEQRRDLRNASILSDIYSLGKLCYYLYAEDDPVEMNYTLIPNDYIHMIMKASSMNPKDRYFEVGHMKADFLAAIEKENEVPFAVFQRVITGSNPESILRCLLKNLGDFDTMIYGLPHMDYTLLTKLIESYPQGFKEILKGYITQLPNVPWNRFEYCDTIARFCSNIYEWSVDYEVKKLALITLLEQGARFNRFHAGDILDDMYKKYSEDEFFMSVLIDELRKNDSIALFYSGVIDNNSAPPILKKIIEDAKKIIEEARKREEERKKDVPF